MTLDRTTPPPICRLGEFNLIGAKLQTMRNGMPLHVIQAGTEDVVRFDLLIEAGQLDQQQPLQAVLTNRMLREGTSNHTSAQIAEKLDYYGAWLELSSTVNYGFVTLYSLNKYFEQTLAIVADIVKHATFPEDTFSVVVNASKQQYLVNSERVGVITRKQLNRSLFGEAHPLGRYAETADYDNITTDQLKAFHKQYYYSGNASIYVSGKVTNEIIRCIEKHLGNEPWGTDRSKAAVGYVPPRGIKEKQVFVERKDALQSSLRMGSFVMDRKHPDFLKMRVLVTLLGGYFGSRLMSNIREEKGYTYGIGAGMVTYPDISMLSISTEADNRYIAPIVTEVYNEIDKLQNEPVSTKELEMVRNYMLGDWCRSYEGPFSLSDAWILIETAGLEDSYLMRSLDAIRETTQEDIQRLAQMYFCKENLIEVVAGKKV